MSHARDIPVAQLDQGDLAAVIGQVVAEVAAARPAATIVSHVNVPDELRFDPVRLQQLLANLLNNAVVHGDTRRPIRVDGRLEDDAIVLAVTNFGTPIDPATQVMLFQPFYRPESATPRPGLGPGLISHRKSHVRTAARSPSVPARKTAPASPCDCRSAAPDAQRAALAAGAGAGAGYSVVVSNSA